MKFKKIMLFSTVFALAPMTSCGGQESNNNNNNNNGNNGDNNEITLTGINLNIDKSEITLEETANLTVTFEPENAANKEYTFTYDSSLLSITNNVVHPIKVGEGEIKVVSKEGSFEDSVSIKIVEPGEDNMVSEAEFISNLTSSPYKNDMFTESFYGLSDAGEVGVVASKMNEELYPVPEDVTVYKASEYGITPDNLVNNSEKLNILINDIRNVAGNKVIEFEDATYIFNSTISIKDISDLYLSGKDNTKFVFSGWLTYLSASNATNLHLNSLKFDMDPAPTIVGNVVEVTDKGNTADIVLSIPDEFDLTNPTYESWKNTRQISYAECYYDELAKWYVPDRNGNLFYNSPASYGIDDMVYNDSDKTLTVTLNKSFAFYNYTEPKIGTVASIGFTVYEFFGFLFSDCENTYLENVTTYTAAGMGLRANGGKNMYLNRTNFMHNPDSKRILTCTADIIHTAALEGELKITNSIIEGSHDDGLNIKTYYTQVTANRGSSVIQVSQTQNEVAVGYEVGDVIDVYSRDGMEFKGRFTLEGVQDLGGSYILTLDGSLRNATGLLVGNHTKATRMTLDNCLIQNKRNRGILLQARESVIKNCTFMNVNMGAVQVLGVGDQFSEAIVPQDISIYNCKFLNSWDNCRNFTYGYDGKTFARTLLNLDIYNNFFYNGVGVDTYLLGVGDAEVKNNFYYKDDTTAINSTSNLMEISYSDNVLIKDNRALIANSDKVINFVKQGDGLTNINLENNEVLEG